MGGISWLASYPKSGNTWLRMFLASYRNGGVRINPNAIPAEIDVADHQDHHYYNVSPFPIEKLSQVDILQLRGAVLVKILTDMATRPLFVKTHNARVVMEDVRLIPQCYTGPSVYIVRDPRDVAISFAHWTSGGDVDEAIRLMSAASARVANPSGTGVSHYLGNWSAHVMSWQQPDTMTIRYEDMLAEPEEAFGAVVQHVGWGYDAETVKMAASSVCFANLAEAEEKERFSENAPGVAKFFRKGEAGQWRDVLTKDQVARIRNDHGIMMDRFGYE